MARWSWIAFAIALPATAFAQTPEEKGTAIARAADAANSGYGGEQADLEMTLVNAQGDEVKRRLAMRIAEMPDDGDRSLITFEWPADVKGTRMLTWSHRKDDDDQWLFLPTLKRVKRIAARGKSGAFMGSEFAYEDLGSSEVDKYAWTFEREESIEGRPCQVLGRVPKDKRSGYSRQVVWLDDGYQQAVRIEFFDRKGELLKTMTFSHFTQYGKYWRANLIEVSNHQTHKRSMLAWTKRSVGGGAAPEDFDPDALGD